MIELFKLISLPQTQKIRKIIKIIETLEYECLAAPGDTLVPDLSLSCDAFYLQGLLKHITEQYPDDEEIAAAVESYTAELQLGRSTGADCRAVCNKIRHALYRHSGIQPSEWDLIAPGTRYGMQPVVQDSRQKAAEYAAGTRPYYPGLYVYAEDIRAPFNLGSIFRTAEAFGVEKLFISQDCVSPDQPRAQRSAMGCTGFLPWERTHLERLPADIPVFALETGGTPITSFPFPQQGVVLVGSEELGLSAEALKRASAGVVSIPMKGVKASLNVAVAFGILMQCWTASLQ